MARIRSTGTVSTNCERTTGKMCLAAAIHRFGISSEVACAMAAYLRTNAPRPKMGLAQYSRKIFAKDTWLSPECSRMAPVALASVAAAASPATTTPAESVKVRFVPFTKKTAGAMRVSRISMFIGLVVVLVVYF